ncbi:hypothetical protein ACT80S_04280 [Ramlibacter sp. MAHUQ-53]|uniref:hypothetical protein n=1 Tax=unclassified Ramlibacter TaxID=2617605 RepID=UPI003633E07F
MNPTTPPAPAGDMRDPALARWRHALRGPLGALLAAAEVLQAAPPHSAAAGEARRVIARQARRLAWMISAPPGEADPD